MNGIERQGMRCRSRRETPGTPGLCETTFEDAIAVDKNAWVVCRLPLIDHEDAATEAVGFAFYDRFKIDGPLVDSYAEMVRYMEDTY